MGAGTSSTTASAICRRGLLPPTNRRTRELKVLAHGIGRRKECRMFVIEEVWCRALCALAALCLDEDCIAAGAGWLASRWRNADCVLDLWRARI